MRILLKYLFRNIMERKFRSFLVFISVALTSGLFFTSLAITDTVKEVNLELYRSKVGKADIRIFPRENELGEPYIDLKGTGIIKGQADYVVGTLDGSALYAPSDEEMTYVNVIGTALEDLKTHNPVVFSEKDLKGDFAGKQIIISRVTAEKYNLSQGDTMELDFGNQKESFYIYGIAELKGIFLMEGASTTVLMTKSAVEEVYGLYNQVNNIYIRLKDKNYMEEALQKLRLQYPDCEVTQALDESDLKQSEVEMPLKLVTIFIILMCIFIVYTSFKIISIERIPSIGAFRSVGATKRMSGWILKLESLLYGAAGGIAGLGIGLAALWFITKVMAADAAEDKLMLPAFSPVYLLLTFLFALVITYASALFPIRGLLGMPAKNLILGQTGKEKKQHIKRTVAAGILLVLSVLLPLFIPKKPLLVIILDSTCMGAVLVSIVILLPAIVNLMVPILQKLLSLFGKDGALAAKNLKNNKSILNVTGLLVIGISTLIVISSINRSIVDNISNLFSETINYDIQLIYRNADEKSLVSELRGMEGITDAMGVIWMQGLEISGSGELINSIYGVEPESFLNYWNFDISPETMLKLKEGRNIILGIKIMDNLNLKTGDSIQLAFSDGVRSYNIIGALHTFYDNGSLGLISKQNIIRDSENDYYSSIYIKTDCPAEQVQKKLQARYLRNLLYNLTKSDILMANTEGVERVFKILKSYSNLTMLIGMIGIINNLLISFMERKRSFAVLRSIGMSRLQLKKMIFLEAVSGGAIGGIAGLLAAGLMLYIVPDVLRQMMGPMEIVYSLPLFLLYFIVALIIMIVTSLIPAIRTSKLSIIESIKYE